MSIKNISFGNLYLTTAKPNLSEKIQKTAKEYENNYYQDIREQSKKIFEELKQELNLTPADKINKYEDLKNVDIFVLAAGKGSRFAKMCDAIEEQTGIKNNKITIPVKTEQGEFHLLDTALALGTPFADDSKGIEIIEAEEAKGSFHDVFNHYKQNAKKDFVIFSGDCIYGKGADLKSMMKYIITSVNNKNKQLGLFAAEMTPDRAAGRAAVVTIDTNSYNKDLNTFYVDRLKEKPDLIYTINNSVIDSKNARLITYGTAGGFYSSQQTLEKVMSELEENPDFIKKNDKEIHDFALYADKTVENSEKWFNKASNQTVDVKVLSFDDVGNPSSFLDVLEKIKTGDFTQIQNLPKETQVSLSEALKARLQTISGIRTIDIGGQYGNNMAPESIIKTAPIISDDITKENIRVIA